METRDEQQITRILADLGLDGGEVRGSWLDRARSWCDRRLRTSLRDLTARDRAELLDYAASALVRDYERWTTEREYRPAHTSRPTRSELAMQASALATAEWYLGMQHLIASDGAR